MRLIAMKDLLMLLSHYNFYSNIDFLDFLRILYTTHTIRREKHFTKKIRIYFAHYFIFPTETFMYIVLKQVAVRIFVCTICVCAI